MPASIPAVRKKQQKFAFGMPGLLKPPATGVGAYNPPPAGGVAQTIQHEGVGGKWVHPDYGALLQGDPTWGQTRAQIAAARGTAGQSLSAAIKQAITRFGMAPKGWNPATPGIANPIDAATIAAAQENPLSTVRGLEEERGRGRADLSAALAGRGMIGLGQSASGALTAGEQKVQTDYERAQGMATQQLLDALAGYEQGYGQSVNELAMEEARAREAAAGRIMGTYQPEWQFDTPPWTETIPAPTATPATWQQIMWGPAGLQATPEEYEAALREWIAAGAGDPTQYGYQYPK